LNRVRLAAVSCVVLSMLCKEVSYVNGSVQPIMKMYFIELLLPLRHEGNITDKNQHLYDTVLTKLKISVGFIKRLLHKVAFDCERFFFLDS